MVRKAQAVASVYWALPPEQRRRAVLVASNYGEAGALDFYGPALRLPPAVSPAGIVTPGMPALLPGSVLWM